MQEDLKDVQLACAKLLRNEIENTKTQIIELGRLKYLKYSDGKPLCSTETAERYLESMYKTLTELEKTEKRILELTETHETHELRETYC